jgi:hypothetical protein
MLMLFADVSVIDQHMLMLFADVSVIDQGQYYQQVLMLLADASVIDQGRYYQQMLMLPTHVGVTDMGQYRQPRLTLLMKLDLPTQVGYLLVVVVSSNFISLSRLIGAGLLGGSRGGLRVACVSFKGFVLITLLLGLFSTLIDGLVEEF